MFIKYRLRLKHAILVTFGIFLLFFLILALQSQDGTGFYTDDDDQLVKAARQLEVLPDIYQKELNDEEKAFLKLDLSTLENNPKSNWLSQRLTSRRDVIVEQNRVLHQIFARIIGPQIKKAILIVKQDWGNLGDHLVSYSELKMLNYYNIDLIEVCYWPSKHREKPCDFSGYSQNDPNLAIFITGGGYMGGTPLRNYKTSPILRNIRNAVDHFVNNRIIFFPQGKCNNFEEENLCLYHKSVANHKDVYVMLRDQCMYEVSKRTFVNAKVLLSPDIAFFYGPVRLNLDPTFDIIWMHRKDTEKAVIHVEPVKMEGAKILNGDWEDDSLFMKPPVDMDGEVSPEYHAMMALSAMIHLSRGKIVVTDRLHGHLMSVLLNKQNIAINTPNKKIQCYIDTWHKSLKLVHYAEDHGKAKEIAMKLLN